nr:hypothetical protein [Tanacetum cinerariifolium]
NEALAIPEQTAAEFEDPNYPDKVYKVVRALYGLHQALRACQDKYVAEILRKFGLTDSKSAGTPIDTEKPLLKDPDEINGGYVAFGGNPKGGKITGKGIQGNFNAGKLVKEAVSAQQYVLLPLWSTGPKDLHNTDVDAALDVKENDNEVHVSPSSSDKTKKHNEKAKREAKGKSPVYLSIGVRDLRDDFEEFFVNSTNMVNAASAPITAVGPNPTNSTNNFNAASPSDYVVRPKFEIGGKSLFVDPSHYPDDPDIPSLKDIVYSDDEDNVEAEAGFSNLETHISVSPIPTTRVHKDHIVSQIIGELTTAPQTRSMARMVKE